MKAVSIVAVLIAIFAMGCGQKVVDSSKLLERSGLNYEINSDKPFTGVAVEYWSNGQKKIEAEYHDGKLQGKYKTWSEKGQKLTDLDYDDGKTVGGILASKINFFGKNIVCDPVSNRPLTGMGVTYNSNGQKSGEAEYRDGKRHGKVTWWYENGQKSAEAEFRDDKLHGKSIAWNDNGQKAKEIEWSNGKQNGKSIAWHDNGQKKWESEYRDGEEIRGKRWDENGNPI